MTSLWQNIKSTLSPLFDTTKVYTKRAIQSEPAKQLGNIALGAVNELGQNIIANTAAVTTLKTEQLSTQIANKINPTGYKIPEIRGPQGRGEYNWSFVLISILIIILVLYLYYRYKYGGNTIITVS